MFARRIAWHCAIAGEGIRTADVQLGTMLVAAQVVISAVLMRVFWRRKRFAHWLQTRMKSASWAEQTHE